jgi:hypothetical protein
VAPFRPITDEQWADISWDELSDLIEERAREAPRREDSED